MSGRNDEQRAGIRRRAFAEFEDPRYDWMRQRQGRRRLVAAHLVWMLVAYVAFGIVIESGAGMLPFAVVGLVWLVVFVVLMGWLNASVSGVTALPYDVLDESQSTVRRRAESDSHRVVQVVMFVVGVWAFANLGARIAQLSSTDAPADASELVWLIPRLPPQAATWVLLGVGLVAALLAILPTYLLAWRLPEDAGEPEAASS